MLFEARNVVRHGHLHITARGLNVQPGMTRLVVAMAVMSTVAVLAEAQPQPALKRTSIFRVSATAYCIDGLTKSGLQTRKGIVAADPDVLPLGTIVRVYGLARQYNGEYMVADTGRAVKGREIDIFVDDCRVAKRFGRQPARVRVLGHRPIKTEGVP